MDTHVKKARKNKTAKFTLHTRYGYEHIGLRDKIAPNDKRTPFPGLMLLSIRVSQLNNLLKNKTLAPHDSAKKLLHSLEGRIENLVNELTKKNTQATLLIETDKQILHDMVDEEWTKDYELFCDSRTVWKAIRALILYDSIALKYLCLWKTACINKNTCFSNISECSSAMRRLFADFNIDAKKLIYAQKEK